MFEFLKSKRRKDEDKAGRALQVALTFVTAIEVDELFRGDCSCLQRPQPILHADIVEGQLGEAEPGGLLGGSP